MYRNYTESIQKIFLYVFCILSGSSFFYRIKDLLAVDRNKMEKFNLKMEKGNYVISKLLPNLRDQHSKMETTHKLILC